MKPLTIVAALALALTATPALSQDAWTPHSPPVQAIEAAFQAEPKTPPA